MTKSLISIIFQLLLKDLNSHGEKIKWGLAFKAPLKKIHTASEAYACFKQFASTLLRDFYLGGSRLDITDADMQIIHNAIRLCDNAKINMSDCLEVLNILPPSKQVAGELLVYEIVAALFDFSSGALRKARWHTEAFVESFKAAVVKNAVAVHLDLRGVKYERSKADTEARARDQSSLYMLHRLQELVLHKPKYLSDAASFVDCLIQTIVDCSIPTLEEQSGQAGGNVLHGYRKAWDGELRNMSAIDIWRRLCYWAFTDTEYGLKVVELEKRHVVVLDDLAKLCLHKKNILTKEFIAIANNPDLLSKARDLAEVFWEFPRNLMHSRQASIRASQAILGFILIVSNAKGDYCKSWAPQAVAVLDKLFEIINLPIASEV